MTQRVRRWQRPSGHSRAGSHSSIPSNQQRNISRNSRDRETTGHQRAVRPTASPHKEPKKLVLSFSFSYCLKNQKRSFFVFRFFVFRFRSSFFFFLSGRPQELSNMAWACARLYVQDPRFWSSLQTQAKRWGGTRGRGERGTGRGNNFTPHRQIID